MHLSKYQIEAIKKPCPHCEIGKLYEVEDTEREQESYLWCDNCLLSMDSSGGYTY